MKHQVWLKSPAKMPAGPIAIPSLVEGQGTLAHLWSADLVWSTSALFSGLDRAAAGHGALLVDIADRLLTENLYRSHRCFDFAEYPDLDSEGEFSRWLGFSVNTESPEPVSVFVRNIQLASPTTQHGLAALFERGNYPAESGNIDLGNTFVWAVVTDYEILGASITAQSGEPMVIEALRAVPRASLRDPDFDEAHQWLRWNLAVELAVFAGLPNPLTAASFSLSGLEMVLAETKVRLGAGLGMNLWDLLDEARETIRGMVAGGRLDSRPEAANVPTLSVGRLPEGRLGWREEVSEYNLGVELPVMSWSSLMPAGSPHTLTEGMTDGVTIPSKVAHYFDLNFSLKITEGQAGLSLQDSTHATLDGLIASIRSFPDDRQNGDYFGHISFHIAGFEGVIAFKPRRISVLNSPDWLENALTKTLLRSAHLKFFQGDEDSTWEDNYRDEVASLGQGTPYAYRRCIEKAMERMHAAESRQSGQASS